MDNKINPCLYCRFDWKDYCSDEKRQECIEIYKQKKKQIAEGGIENGSQ